MKCHSIRVYTVCLDKNYTQWKQYNLLDIIMRGSRKLCQSRSKFDKVILVDEGIEDPNTVKNGPSSARQLNAI